MAILHFALKSLSRGKGHSATAAAAYRAGLSLDDPTTGEVHDYTRRRGVMGVDMLAPKDAPAWALDPHQLWGRVEANETRKNARIAREVVIALPHELDPEARRALARDVGQLLVDRYGVAVQIALHAPDKGGDERNFHAHLLLTPRQVGASGFGAHAAKVLDEFPAGAAEIKAVRAAVADCINRALLSGGVRERVDPRRLEEQKLAAAERGDFQAAAQLDRLPTKHEGKATTQARRRGERTPRARRNDRRTRANDTRLKALEERFQELKNQAAAEGRLAQVDEQQLHAQALLDVAYAKARQRQAAYRSSTPTRSPHGPQRHLATALTGDCVHSRSHPAGRQPRGLEPLPAVRPLDGAATHGRQPGHPGRPGGFAPFARPLLRTDAPGHHDTNSGLQRLRAERAGLSPKPAKPKAPRKARTTGTPVAGGRTRVTGDGTREGERLAKIANIYIQGLEDSIAELLRTALKWAQGHDQLVVQRMATHYLNAQGDARVVLLAREHVAEQLHAATQQREDLAKRAKKGAAGLKGIDRWAASLGWTPKSLRDLIDAQKQAEDLVEMVREADRQVAADAQRAQAEVKRHQDRLLEAYEKAQPPDYPTFPNRDQAPDPATQAKAGAIQKPAPSRRPAPPRPRPRG